MFILHVIKTTDFSDAYTRPRIIGAYNTQEEVETAIKEHAERTNGGYDVHIKTRFTQLCDRIENPVWDNYYECEIDYWGVVSLYIVTCID